MKNKTLFLLLFCFLNSFSMEADNITINNPQQLVIFDGPSKNSTLATIWSRLYTLLFGKRKIFNAPSNPRNDPSENSLTKIFKIDENNDQGIKNLLIQYLNYSCSNKDIFKFDKERNQYRVENSTEGSRFLRALSLFIHPDKFTEENGATAKTFFQILMAQEKQVVIPLESKSFYIRCFRELLNKHTDIKEFEQELEQVYQIATDNRFSLEIFHNRSIEEIIQNKKTLDEEYKNSWQFKIKQFTESIIEKGLLQVFSQSIGSKLARAFIDLNELKNKRYYDQACKHYDIDKITDPNKKMFIKDRLKNDYDQYSHAQRLQQAIFAAAPFFNNARLQKYLPYF